MALDKARLVPEKGSALVCLFNPAELTIARSNGWNAAESKGGNAPQLRFQGGQSGTLSLTLVFDTTDTGEDVAGRYTNRLLGLMDVDAALSSSDKQRNSARPPWVTFQWGRLVSFKTVLERVQIRFTYFAANGTPLRARAEISLKQWRDESVQPLQNPTSHTPSLTSVHRVVEGETLDRIAARYYGDPTRWRLLAQANGITDPLRISAGRELAVPELPVVRRG